MHTGIVSAALSLDTHQYVVLDLNNYFINIFFSNEVSKLRQYVACTVCVGFDKVNGFHGYIVISQIKCC